MKILVYGYGNPGRQDDGLGVEITERLESMEIPGVYTDSNYQLNIEDADNISEYDVVIFADASLNAKAPFEFTELKPDLEISFTTHAMSPGSVMALCHDIYGKCPKAYVLAVPGYSWEFQEEMTDEAKDNLENALAFISEALEKKKFDEPEAAKAEKA